MVFNPPKQGHSASTNSSPTVSRAARRSEPIFVSSRDFEKQVATFNTEDPSQQPAKEGGMKRSDRKSKTDAMNAVSANSSNDVGGEASSWPSGNGSYTLGSEGVSGPPNPANHPARKAFQAQAPPPLPFNNSNIEDEAEERNRGPTIPTAISTPRHPPPRTRPRLFELEEAPTFYPTWEEFSDPLKFIEWVGSPQGGNGKEYGIVKIVPPEGWNPEFVLDQQRFRFRTRVQRLNSLSADARASLNYQEQLQKFHAQQGRKRVSIPMIDRRPLDLYGLKLVVGSFGGYDAVVKARRWAEVTRNLGYNEKDSAHLAAQVKAAYVKIILPFEQFLLKAKEQAKLNGNTTSPTGLASLSSLSARATPMGTPSSAPQSERCSTPQRSVAGPLGTKLDSPSPMPPTAPAHAIPSETVATSHGGEEGSNIESDMSTNGKRRSTRKRSETGPGESQPSSFMQAPLCLSKLPLTPNAVRRRKGISPHIDNMNAESEIVIVPGAEEQMCEICLRGDDGINMLLCDECNRGYHMYCLQPPLTSIPKSQWFCPPCLVGTGNDYGFDDGETHSLHSFWKRAESFKKAWWTQRPERIWKGKSDAVQPDLTSMKQEQGMDEDEWTKPNGLVRKIAGTDLTISEDDVEREFWRLINSPDETVEVEYGADVHSTTHGSALPTMETHPLSPYSKDGWNLNNLPILPGSLLRYIKSDISGMTVPWIYVGMMFSTFCWHNEDHYTYSINYQHWGDTKCWYGVPGGDAEKFEEAMRKAAPDLFETSPDLLFQLVTMMSPDKLKKEGVRVYAVDQRANEFVITYPKAYHSGFNQGYNLNEAVNFALPDWIFEGLDCARRYQHFGKFPVFSHDELVITVSQHNQTVGTAVWLQHAMKEMVDREIAKRDALREIIPGLTELVEDHDRPEFEYQCAFCNVFCYLGQITSEKAEGVACLDHGFQVCGADSPTRWVLRLRFSDEQLRNNYNKVAERAAVPKNWENRLRKLLLNNARPPLRSLRGLLHEAERIPYRLPDLEQLKDFVDRANEWVESANSFIARKHHKRRSDGTATGRKRRSLAVDDSPSARVDSLDDGASDAGSNRSPEAMKALLAEVDLLPFDAPEIGALKNVVDQVNQFQHQALELLKRGEDAVNQPTMEELEEVQALGASLSVDLESLDDLSMYIQRRKWISEMDEIHQNFINLGEVEELISEAEKCDIPKEHKHLSDLRKRLEAGKAWASKAEGILDGDGEIHPRQLEELTTAPYEVAVIPELHLRAEGLLNKSKDWSRTLRTLYNETESELPDEPMDVSNNKAVSSEKKKSNPSPRANLINETRRILRIVSSNRLVLPLASELKAAVEVHDSWRRSLFDLLSSCSKVKSINEKNAAKEVESFCTRMKAVSDAADDTPLEGPVAEAPQRHCLCRTTVEPDYPGGATCQACGLSYHISCLQYESKDVPKAGLKWTCPVCLPTKLSQILSKRLAINLSSLDSLFSPEKFSRRSFRFVPEFYDSLASASDSAHRFRQLALDFLDSNKPFGHRSQELMLRHLTRKAIGSPVNIETKDGFGLIDTLAETLKSNTPSLIATSTPAPVAASDPAAISASGSTSAASASSIHPPRPPPPSTAQGGAVALATPATNSSSPTATSGSRDDKKRKRGKRAKFVFREEVGILVPVNGERIYCLCHKAETGTMISCDRCMLWFHNTCVHVDDTADLGDERWICPMCCVKTERKYSHAEVKVKDMEVTDPDMWLDIRASLRSTGKPISKPQQWTVEESRRIVLHLESFYPAINADRAHSEAKRMRLETDSPKPATFSAHGGLSASSGATALMSAPGAPGPDSGATGSSVVDRIQRIPSPPATFKPVSSSRANRQDSRDIYSNSPGSSKTSSSSSVSAQEHHAATQERHRAGMANLYARGVTDAMIRKWYVGWNGRTLVYPRYDANGKMIELDLGPRINLDPDDQDGSRLIRYLLDR
ncbi:hypothetical protein IE53DRAFT_323024, partial [Violaceomyces palustris]